jgi:large subunit ribosomal protein L4
MQHEVINLKGEKIKNITLSKTLFDVEFKSILLKEVIEYQQNKSRQATYGTCRRRDLSFSTRKIRKQKGSGRSRAGPFGAPQYRKGAVAFGPDGRIYKYEIPKKKKQIALAMCLSQKLKDKKIIFVDNLEFNEIKTKKFLEVCKNLNLEEKILFVDAEKNQNIFLSMRNVVGFDFLPVIGLNPLSIVKSKKLVITESAIQSLEKRYESL